mgnify:CR=1 FL=1
METTIISAINSCDTQARQRLAKAIRTNPDAYNGVNGIGGQTDLPKGQINGFVHFGDTMIGGAKIKAEKGDEIQDTGSSDKGMYSFKLSPGLWQLTFTMPGYYDTVIDVAVIS